MSDPTGPARRGGRDPELRRRITRDEGVVTRVPDETDEPPEMHYEAEVQLDNEGEDGPSDFALLLPGDILAVKTSSQGKDAWGDEVWHSFGLQSRVQPDEAAADAVDRVTFIANEGVLGVAADFAQRQAALVEERRNRPIKPTR